MRVGLVLSLFVCACSEIAGLGPERVAVVPDAAFGGAGAAAGATSTGGAGSGGSGAMGGTESGGSAGSVNDAGDAGAPDDASDASDGPEGSPPPPPLANCTDVLITHPVDTKNGVFDIDPDGPGALPEMSAWCELETAGGGWTLVLRYLHQAHTNPILLLRASDLPLFNPLDTLGIDESGGKYWGHAANVLVDALKPTQLWFWGATSNHQRIMTFTTSHAGCLAYVRTGTGSCSGIQTSFTPLPGHDSFLPAQAGDFFADKGNDALVDYPFYLAAAYHWSVNGGGLRWEVDDWVDDSFDTDHRVYVRSDIQYLASCAAIAARNPAAPSGNYYVDPDGPGGQSKQQELCQFP